MSSIGKKHTAATISKAGHLLRNILDKSVMVNRQAMNQDPMNSSQILKDINLSRITLPDSHPLKNKTLDKFLN
jgi:hypothetical protein